MRIAVDESIPGAVEVFGRLGEVSLFTGRSLQAEDLRQADALIVRSVTPVGPNLLDGTPIRFVGTATSGVDHVDAQYLQNRGIHFADAAGCNSRAVAEYLIAALCHVSAREKKPLAGQTIGIIGCGRIGSLVSHLCHILGTTVLHNDPPLAREGRLKNHVEIDELLPQCDFVTIHVPLTSNTAVSFCPTRNMVDGQFLAKMKPGACLFNTARGEVVDAASLTSALSSKRVRAVLDVWPREPEVDAALANLVEIGTPHLAGYSLQSKRRATAMIARSLAAWMGETQKTPAITGECESDKDTALSLKADILRENQLPETALAALLTQICPLAEIDRQLRAAVRDGRIAQAFDAIRSAHAGRREWSSVRVDISMDGGDQVVTQKSRELFAAMGFQIG